MVLSNDHHHEIVNRNSRYEQLLRGEIGGEDIKLIFVDSSDNNNNDHAADGSSGGGGKPKRKSKYKSKGGLPPSSKQQPIQNTTREIMAHKAFLHSCKFITAAFTENRFAEGESGEICINVPPGTYGAVDALIRWCYDSKCQFDIVETGTEFITFERYVKGIPALWVLADYMQCQELCHAIIDVLKNGKLLRTGMSFAILVDEVLELGVVANLLLGAAIEGLPLDPTEREELEILLDYGGDKMLDALAKCDNLLGRTTDNSMGGNDGENDVILTTLGEYLAEMKRHDRAKLLPSLFARCLLKFPPCTLPEANYATMIFDYINDREESGHKLSESCVMAFLGTIDFVSISRGALLNNFIPKAEKLSPSYALVLNDLTGFNYPPLITRCAYSMQKLSPSKGLRPSYPKVAVLSCGNIVSEDSVGSILINGKNIENCSDGVKIIICCPFCKHRGREWDGGRYIYSRVHWLRVKRKRGWREYDYDEYYTPSLTDDRNIEDKIELKFSEIEPSRSFFDRKDTKIAALTHWITSEGDSEDENATSETTHKRFRGDSSSLLQSKGLFVRVLNQCSEIDSEKTFFHIIGSSDWRIMSTIEAFAKKLTTIPADKINHATRGIGFFRYEPNGYSLGERLEPDSKWNEIGFNLRGSDEELIVARRLQMG